MTMFRITFIYTVLFQQGNKQRFILSYYTFIIGIRNIQGVSTPHAKFVGRNSTQTRLTG